MNVHTTQDIVTIPRESALKVYTEPGAIQPFLDQIKVEVDSFTALGLTVATKKDREQIRSMAFRLARTRTALENVGKLLADEVKAIPKKVDATRRLVREQIEAWEEEVRGPLTAWEQAEKARVAGHEEALAAIPEAPGYGMAESAAEIRTRLDWLRNQPARDWEEFAERAAAALAAEIERTEKLVAAAEKREAEAAELARLRKAEEDRLAAERAAQAQREAEERDRRIAEEAAAAERLRAEQDRQRAEREKQEAEERAARAEREKAEAEDRARLAAEKAERDRLAAVEAERQRQAEEKAAEERAAAAREADKKHRAAVNNAAKDAFVAAGLSDAAATTAVTAIAKRQIPHVIIQY